MHHMEKLTAPANPTHDYELSLIAYVVIHPINGDTDWYTRAGFETLADADKYAAYLNRVEPHDLPYRVMHIGTAHR
jgi:hypothetical protein